MGAVCMPIKGRLQVLCACPSVDVYWLCVHARQWVFTGALCMPLNECLQELCACPSMGVYRYVCAHDGSHVKSTGI